MEELTGDSALGDDWALVRLRVDEGRIVDADAEGLRDELRGLSLFEAAAVGGETLVVDALANAIGPVVSAEPDPDRTAVAMSGGVDSAVALLRAGRGAVGVTLRLWVDPHAPDTERACCSPSAVLAARDACHVRGLPHVTLDLREQFRASVVAPFVAGYAAGETPNPCIRCNGSFRFDELLAFRSRIGAARLATGHYARIVRHRGQRLLARGIDEQKDQSYMLAALEPALLEHVWFPLGDQTKDATRGEAERASLPAARRAESQEACFLGGGDYRAFLERYGVRSRAGAIVDEEGAILGSHRGHWGFTPGQRRGLNVAGREPLYVLRSDAVSNTVVAGPRSSLARTQIRADGTLHVPVERALVKLRYRSTPVGAAVCATDDGFDLELDEPAFGVAPGQGAVLYDGDAVVGFGVVA